MEINIAKDYSDKPGARYEKQGSNSGEKFRVSMLYPKFIEAIKNNDSLTVNLDGGYGYGASFLEEAFGGLVRKLKQEKNDSYKKVKEIRIISKDNDAWIDKIQDFITKAMEQ